MLCNGILCNDMLCYSVLCYATLSYNMLYCVVLYCTVLYCTVLYCTKQQIRCPQLKGQGHNNVKKVLKEVIGADDALGRFVLPLL